MELKWKIHAIETLFIQEMLHNASYGLDSFSITIMCMINGKILS